MTNTTKIRAVLYDMDGTLLDTEKLHSIAWEKALAMHGVRVTQEFYARATGTNTLNVKRLLKELYNLDNGEEMLGLERDLLWAYMQEHGIPVLPGVPETLTLLRQQGIKQCLCTSTGRADAVKWLQACGLLPLFDALVCGDDIHASKPDPDIFLVGAQKVSTPIAACAVIEDSTNGLKAGLASGAKVFRVEGVQPVPEDIIAKTHFLKDFYELPKLL